MICTKCNDKIEDGEPHYYENENEGTHAYYCINKAKNIFAGIIWECPYTKIRKESCPIKTYKINFHSIKEVKEYIASLTDYQIFKGITLHRKCLYDNNKNKSIN